MALGSQAQRLGLILFAATLAAAQPVEVNAIEKRLARDRPGKLHFGEQGVAFSPAKGKSRQWIWTQIQRLELTGEGELFLTLYRDVWWQAERDQRLHFTSKDLSQMLLPPADAHGSQPPPTPNRPFLSRDREGAVPQLPSLLAALHNHLGDRFIPRLAVSQGPEIWRTEAKLLRGWGGPEGDFILNSSGWQFLTRDPNHSFSIEDRLTANISSTSDLQLTVAAAGGKTQYEFQLKSPLPREVYQTWWHRLNRPRGLDLIQLDKEPSR